MGKDILSLQPARLWQHFYDLTQIPRPSKKERKAVDFVAAFGRQLGLFTDVDAAGNVLIRKPATKGMEGRRTVILQAHLDMVPQKNSDTAHDFERDPIDAYISGEFVRAHGTTLGADNGVGVAAAMAVLEAADVEHPNIEALFTIDEETGMSGALAMQPGWLQGDILLNLDSEDEGELCVGCAGGLDGSFGADYDQQDVAADSAAFELSITGLKGGHSGVDIALGRANANKLAARVLRRLTDICGVQLVSLEGGNLRNAIPREAFATIVVPKATLETLDAVKREVAELAKAIANEYAGVEDIQKMKITLEPANAPGKAMQPAPQDRLLNAILACPDGVVRMSDAIPGLVETSTNLAIVRIGEGKMSASCLLRSSVDSAKAYLSECMKAAFSLAGVTSRFTGGYPGWKPNPSSAILNVMRDLYEKMFGAAPYVRAIHAGLECGLLGGKYPNLDMISFGPTILNPHSPDERVEISSVEKWWSFLLATLKNTPDAG
ncbi:MAG: aminoacyl-histidine dipeptidase [Prevotellaceae bacterium]|jgi:dipeptidase D|nr:aminoacyl-histidine dipeptidase [Prevotellaceae bacterium]